MLALWAQSAAAAADEGGGASWVDARLARPLEVALDARGAAEALLHPRLPLRLLHDRARGVFAGLIVESGISSLRPGRPGSADAPSGSSFFGFFGGGDPEPPKAEEPPAVQPAQPWLEK